MRPKSIIEFEWIFLAYLLIGMAGTILFWPERMAIYHASRGHQLLGDDAPAFASAIGFGVQILLWFLIARAGSSVAKWIYVVLVVCGFISVATSVASGQDNSTALLIFTTLLLLLRFAACWKLFQADSTLWLRAPRS